VDQAVFNLEKNSVSAAMVSDDSKRPCAFCNEEKRMRDESKHCSHTKKRGTREHWVFEQGFGRTRRDANK
jgi:hypothetical protein